MLKMTAEPGPSAVDLNSWATDLAEFLRVLVGRQIQIRTRLDPRFQQMETRGLAELRRAVIEIVARLQLSVPAGTELTLSTVFGAASPTPPAVWPVGARIEVSWSQGSFGLPNSLSERIAASGLEALLDPKGNRIALAVPGAQR